MHGPETIDATEKQVRGYCVQCNCYCPTIALVRNNKFVKVKPDKKHPNGWGLCPKGLSGPELVYNQQRLRFPIRRTQPKGAHDPGWVRISWDDALRTISAKLNEIKRTWGPEAVGITRGGFASSPASEVAPWINRLGNAFGTPNSISTTHICQWHRDHCSGYTFGNPQSRGSAGRAEYENAGVILMWGVNIHATRFQLLKSIHLGLKRGAKLIVIDPRRTKLAALSDIWLQVQPGTDGALALSMINVLIEEEIIDYHFLTEWTTAPFLVRGDTGHFLRESDLTHAGSVLNYVAADAPNKQLIVCTPGVTMPSLPTLDGQIHVTLAGGTEVSCKSAFRLLRDLVSKYRPSEAERITKVPQHMIRAAARAFARFKPACWYSFNGIEQDVNASQTNRAICILYALTGDYDKPGGNVLPPRFPVNNVDGREFLSPEIEKRRLGLTDRPLGLAGTAGSIRPNEFHNAILTGQPYPIKGLLAFCSNMGMSTPSCTSAREALSQLEFHVQVDLFMTPTAELADIVLPAASFWEGWHVGCTISPLGTKAHVQLRPAVVSPLNESWPDIKIVFKIAESLGFDESFWGGDVEAAINYQFAPTGITVDQLRQSPGGISVDLPMEYRKYMKRDRDGNYLGFPTQSRRIEIYSQVFREFGYDPLPAWKAPASSASGKGTYKLVLTGGKVVEYCHTQHRALPSLRKRVPYPLLEMNTRNAAELGCKNGDCVIIESPQASVKMIAKLTDGIPYGVVCALHGWWQGCPELNILKLDPYSSAGANVNLLFAEEDADPISGSLPMKNYPCNVRKQGD